MGPGGRLAARTLGPREFAANNVRWHLHTDARRVCARAAALIAACALVVACAGPAAGRKADHGLSADAAQLTTWPVLHPHWPRDAALEERVATIVAGMSLRDKVAQMTQAEIKTASPDDVREYRLGSVLNGGGSWPGNNRRATARDWLELAQRYYQASLASGAKVPIPVIWGTDAVHGHNNVYGATIFPHNIGLGAAHDAELVAEIGAAVGKAVRATGIQWVFAPTLAVAQDSRWGRSYESFSSDPMLVESYARAYVAGLQGSLRGDGSVVATAKHFLGDGGTFHGQDQGETRAPLSDMINIHARGYYGALEAGVQTVMASYSSWTDTATGVAYGKMHGNRHLLTGVLKDKLGFDGFVVSDWNAIGQLPGCTNASCPAAINAGIDMVMVPDDWKAFIDNTVRQVQQGAIPMTRIDDAVTRILRVKLRSGLFDRSPRQDRYAGATAALVDHAMARRAVRESLVLLKNDHSALPLLRAQRLLVVGKNADSLPAQTGGWSMTWQGTETSNADFPAGETVLDAIRNSAVARKVVYSPTGMDVDVSEFDAVIAVIGETPYAETAGDVPFPAPLSESSRFPEDLTALKAVSGKGRPVVTVLLTGRVQYATDLINLSDAFVVAWLPGTDAQGIVDVLFRGANGRVDFDFRGRLPFAWPASPCQTGFSHNGQGGRPLFPRGYGLGYTSSTPLGQLDEPAVLDTCESTQRSGDASHQVAGSQSAGRLPRAGAVAGAKVSWRQSRMWHD